VTPGTARRPAERRDAGHAQRRRRLGTPPRDVSAPAPGGRRHRRRPARLPPPRRARDPRPWPDLHGSVALPGGAGTGAPLLDEPGTYDAVVRFSRSVGLPPWLPDVYGLAVRLVDAHGHGRHQDLLLDATQPAPLLRRLPWPRWDATTALYGSLLPYEVDGRRCSSAPCVPAPAGPVPGRPAGRGGAGAAARDAHGPWREVGRVRTTASCRPEGRRLRFTPGRNRGLCAPGGAFRSAQPQLPNPRQPRVEPARRVQTSDYADPIIAAIPGPPSP
jgi:hypothetical protein